MVFFKKTNDALKFDIRQNGLLMYVQCLGIGGGGDFLFDYQKEIFISVRDT